VGLASKNTGSACFAFNYRDVTYLPLQILPVSLPPDVDDSIKQALEVNRIMHYEKEQTINKIVS